VPTAAGMISHVETTSTTVLDGTVHQRYEMQLAGIELPPQNKVDTY
jgi:hypothetical protein